MTVGVLGVILPFVAGYFIALAWGGSFAESMFIGAALTSGVTELLVAFFLVNIGMQLNLHVFKDSGVVAFAIILTLIAVITKLAHVGIGMVPRGEVGIVVAQIGLGLGVIGQQFFAAVLFVAVSTT